MITYIVLAVVAIIVIWFILAYNGFVTLTNRVREAWSDIDVQFKRRYDLIPNLVRTVQGAANFENMSRSRGGAQPYAGGISISDKILNELDTDRVQPAFTIDMDDNYLPVGPVGNEGTPQPTDDPSDGSNV